MLSTRFIKHQIFKSKNSIMRFSHHNNQHSDASSCPYLAHKSTNVQSSVRNQAPDFKGTAWWNGEFIPLSLASFQGKWICLFFYPLNFTFVCPTEIVDFNSKSEEFAKLNCQVIGCSIDSHFSHREYALKPRNEGGLAPVSIPLLSDLSHNISKSYGVLVRNENDPLNGVSLRGTFIIDDKQKLRHMSINDASVGRNIDETLRLIKAFQYADINGEVCPSNWSPGKATMSPNVGSKKLNDYWQNEHAVKH